MTTYQSTGKVVRRRKSMSFKKFLIIDLIVLLLLAAGVVFFIAAKSSAAADTGVTSCTQMAERQKAGTKSTGKMDDASYHKVRAPFESSKYADLKTAGTEFVDAVYAGQKALEDDTPLQSSMGVITELSTKYASLQLACRNHGVKLSDLGG